MSIMINGKRRSMKRVIVLAVITMILLFDYATTPTVGYETVKIQQGDTLESVICENTEIPWRGNLQNRIIKTKEVNSINLDTLYPGDKVVIAVYKK